MISRSSSSGCTPICWQPWVVGARPTAFSEKDGIDTPTPISWRMPTTVLEMRGTASEISEALADSWIAGLAPLDGVASEVDDAVVEQGSFNELPKLVILGARRLWRAYLEAHQPRVQSPQPWGAALLAAILELDGVKPPIAAMARLTRSPVSTTRSALTRFRRFLGDLDTNLAHRAFAATTNPQLKKASAPSSETDGGTVVPFPSR